MAGTARAKGHGHWSLATGEMNFLQYWLFKR
jgi:hypothetical protein